MHRVAKSTTAKSAFMSRSKACPRWCCLYHRNNSMQLRQLMAIRFKDIFLLCMPLIHNKYLNVAEGPYLCNQWQQPVLMQLVIYERLFDLLLRTTELFPKNSEAQCNLQWLNHVCKHVWDQNDSTRWNASQLKAESLVRILNWTTKITFIIDVRQPIQQIIFGNSYLVKQNESIVDSILSFLFATVTYRNAS